MATESNGRIIQGNSAIGKKSVVNLFPKQGDCSYVSCYWYHQCKQTRPNRAVHILCKLSCSYCHTRQKKKQGWTREENVYKLVEEVTKAHPNEINKCFVVFISNQSRTVPLWRQRAGKDEDRLVIWDYHVIFLYHPEPDKCLVYDLDSELPFPTYVHKYVTETFRTDHILKSDYFRYFRVIPASEFVKEFASDRRHMRRPDGTWIKPPPNYPAISTPNSTHNLEDYIQMDHSKGPGQVLNLTQFVQRFYKPAT